MSKTLAAVFETLKRPRAFRTFLISSAILAAIYGLLFGMYDFRILSIANLRETPLSWYHYAFIATATLLGGISMALWREGALLRKSSALAFTGSAAGMIGATCPACLGIEFVVLGSALSIPQAVPFIPYIPQIMIASTVLIIIGAWLAARSVAKGEACDVPKRRRSK